MASLTISESEGYKNPIFVKPGHRSDLGGRYQNRNIYDNAMQESEDLWEYAAYAAEGHSSAGVKGTIANLTAVPYQVATQNLPNQTFKDGYIPHTYAGVQSYYENPEPDTQPMRPDISPLEFAGMVQHQGPNDDPRYNAAPDPHNIMVLRQKMRTSYALPPKPAVKYVDERTSRTSINTLKEASARFGQNRGITLTKVEEKKLTEREAVRPTGAVGKMFQGVNMNDLYTKMAGVATASSWSSAAVRAGSAGLEALDPTSSLGKLAQNLKDQGYIPEGLLFNFLEKIRADQLNKQGKGG